jgi:type I restriction enzyme S subunit
MNFVDPKLLPTGWTIASLSEIAAINPRPCSPPADDSTEVNFVPMRAVEPEGKGLTKPEVRTYGEVKKGYTSFLSGDVITAKITPCMENGKTTVVPSLPHELSFGSTEFHVVRPELGVPQQWISQFLLQHKVRRLAQRQMSGAVGQMRVPQSFLEELKIPVAPVNEQQRISDELDELLSDLDAGVEALNSAQAKLALYRASVLKAAVQGDLTAEWRNEHPNVEPASVLLQRILKERRQRWEEEQLRKFKANDKTPPANWKSKYNEPLAPDITNLPALPAGWCWTSFGQCFDVRVGATPSRSEARYWNGDIPWVASGEVQFCRINKTRETISRDGLKNTSTQINPAGSVLLNMIGEGKTRGKAGLLDIDACNNQNCAAIWVSETPIPSLYIYCWLLYQYEQTRQLGSGNNQPAMNGTIVKGILFPLAPLDELVAIVETIDSQMSVVEHLDSDLVAKNESAKALRQSLLRHAFTGQLVAQDGSEEPATELLNRIAAEREARSKTSPKKNSSRTPATSKRRKQTR